MNGVRLGELAGVMGGWTIGAAISPLGHFRFFLFEMRGHVVAQIRHMGGEAGAVDRPAIGKFRRDIVEDVEQRLVLTVDAPEADEGGPGEIEARARAWRPRPGSSHRTVPAT